MRKRINSRAKGAAGEREFAEWLFYHLKLKTKPTRNLEQVRLGGADIIDVPPFIFEVKRCQQLDLRKWWIKLLKDSMDSEIPVVAFRKNNHPWSFLISAKYIGLEKGYIRLEEPEFIKWITQKYSEII